MNGFTESICKGMAKLLLGVYSRLAIDEVSGPKQSNTPLPGMEQRKQQVRAVTSLSFFKTTKMTL
jgi:hypothetical protein